MSFQTLFRKVFNLTKKIYSLLDVNNVAIEVGMSVEALEEIEA